MLSPQLTSNYLVRSLETGAILIPPHINSVDTESLCIYPSSHLQLSPFLARKTERRSRRRRVKRSG
jgi:hypothetical protein